MALPLADLDKSYSIKSTTIHSSSAISSKTTFVLTHLLAKSEGENPPLLTLTARAPNASKLISVVEIAKRQLASQGVKCFQYNALSAEMVEIPREGKGKRKRKGEVNASEEGREVSDHDDDDDDAFETRDVSVGMKKRSVPVLTIWLATVAVRELKNAYGCVFLFLIICRSWWFAACG